MKIVPIKISISPWRRWVLQNKVNKAAPYEICGIILQDGSIKEYANIYNGDKRHNFKAAIDEDPTEIAGIWHSHPNGPRGPSKNDMPLIELLSSIGFLGTYIIVTPYSIQEYRIVQ